jgi:uncharacterized protein
VVMWWRERSGDPASGLGRSATAIALAWLVAACAATSPSSLGPGSDPGAVGRAYLEALAHGDWAAAAAMEDPTMAAAAPAAKLQQLAASLVSQYGPLASVGDGQPIAAPGGGTIVAVTTSFANASVVLDVSVDDVGRVTGLHVGQVSPAAGTSPAPYVDQASFTERAVTVGSAPWTLPGTLTIPNGSGPFPAVVFVAGSGPEDRDETFGLNKPLRDLAWGLATQGIAVLRYDKRTLVYGAQMAQLTDVTVKQETTDDAVAAIALLRGTSGVDPGRVFLVGHSLGATLAPRIASRVPGQLAGIALLEAASTPLPELILEQEEYLTSLQGSPGPSAEDQLAALRAQVQLAESPELSPSTPASELPLGVPAAYWLDLRSYDPLATAASLGLPMFFSQGQRDYQVPPSELPPWQAALAGHSNVTYETYPAMDHLLLDGSGPATPAEYSLPGHVDPRLVADLAAWINGR